MITTWRLPQEAFTALAGGSGDHGVAARLSDAHNRLARLDWRSPRDFSYLACAAASAAAAQARLALDSPAGPA